MGATQGTGLSDLGSQPPRAEARPASLPPPVTSDSGARSIPLCAEIGVRTCANHQLGSDHGLLSHETPGPPCNSALR